MVQAIMLAAEMRGLVHEMALYARDPRHPVDKRRHARQIIRDARKLAQDTEAKFLK